MDGNSFSWGNIDVARRSRDGYQKTEEFVRFVNDSEYKADYEESYT